MPLSILFWVLMIVWLVFGYIGRPDVRIYRDLALILIPLVASLIVYLHYRYRGYREMMVDFVEHGVW